MISEEKLERINQLANKSKNQGLTSEEKEEQKTLRNEYLRNVRQSFKQQLKSVKVKDPVGNDVTPQKVLDLKNDDKNNPEK